jgi:hypothetical protein
MDMPHPNAFSPLDEAVTQPIPVVNPSVAAPGVTTPGATSPGVTTPGATSPGVTAPGATSPGATTPRAAAPQAPPPEASPPEPLAEDTPVYVHYGGWDYIATPEMAGIFLRRAQQLIDDGESQLVPLRHLEGIELLYISADVPFSVRDGEICDLDEAPSVEPLRADDSGAGL